MELGIKGRTAVVTGASSGLGRSIASSLAAEGVRVAVVGRRQDKIASFVEQHGNQHVGLVYDLVPEGNPTRMVDELREKLGNPDIVIHNVGGTLDVTTPFCSLEDWRRVSRFNLEIAIELDLLLIPSMREQQWGRVVYVSSISSVENHGPIPYCTVKAALTAYARSVGRFVAKDGVVVSAVLAGAILTEGGYWEDATANRPEHVDRYIRERMSIGRLGTPDEIGSVATFLCSEHASFVVGSAIVVDGGQGRSFFASESDG